MKLMDIRDQALEKLRQKGICFSTHLDFITLLLYIKIKHLFIIAVYYCLEVKNIHCNQYNFH